MPAAKATPHATGAGTARQVALLVETAIVSGREILKGIGRFLREGHPWSVVHEPRNLLDAAPEWVRRWKGHGIIARVSSPAMARTLQKTRLPVVDVLGLVKDSPFPLVHVDNAALARLAVEHLSSLRPASLGFYGFKGENWSEQRRDAFVNSAQSLGWRPLVLEVERAARFRSTSQERLARWLKSLPRRAGVMACNDELASDLLQTSRREGVTVPADLAVIGVDDDEALCSIACPALTSIRAAHAEVGYQAAQLLNQMMKGAAPKQRQVLISPGDVMARQSTDPLQVADPQLQRALAFIDRNSREKLSVDDVARAAGLSRSVLQRRFRAQLGATVLDAIQKRKIQTACRLLMDTEMKPAEIAERAGFLHPEYFAAVFKKTMSCTPREYRHAVRRGV